MLFGAIHLFCAGDCWLCGAAFASAAGDVVVAAGAFVLALAGAVADGEPLGAGEACGVGVGVASADCD